MHWTWWLFALVAAAIMFRAYRGAHSDFGLFRNAGLSWRGESPGPGPARGANLNSPVWLPIFALLSYLPINIGLLIWQLTGALALTASVRHVVRERPVPLFRLYWLFGALVLVAPMTFAWIYAQVTWLVLYPMTRAWLAAETAPYRAGLWLGLAVVMKPPLALAALLMPRRIVVTAGLVGFAGTVLAIPLLGLSVWRDWLAQAGAVQWLGHMLNVSLVGAAVRLRFGEAADVLIRQLPWSDLVWIAMIGALLGILIRRVRTTDARWILAVWWSVLLSPLGWASYLPLAVGPLLASWRRSWLLRASFIMFVIPLPAYEQVWKPGAAWAPTIATALLGLAYLAPRTRMQASPTSPERADSPSVPS